MTLAFCGEWIEKVPWIRQLFVNRVPDSTKFVVEVARKLVPKIFVTGEVLMQPALYIIRKGLVSCGPRVLSAGSICGEDLLLSDPRNRSQYLFVSLTTTGTLALGQGGLLDTLSRFPVQKQRVRHYTLWLGCKRGLARELKTAAEKRERGSGFVHASKWNHLSPVNTDLIRHRSSWMIDPTVADDEDLAPPVATVPDVIAAVRNLEHQMKQHHTEVLRMINLHVARQSEEPGLLPGTPSQQSSARGRETTE